MSAVPLPATERRFVAMAVPGRGQCPSCNRSAPRRRIWEVDLGAVFVALGVLVERSELEVLFLELFGEERGSTREDVLLRDAVGLCARPCRFAETVERLLDDRARRLRPGVGGSPLYEPRWTL